MKWQLGLNLVGAALLPELFDPIVTQYRMICRFFGLEDMMNIFYRIMPGCAVWLDTQTWSYKAIGIYLDLGFVPMKTATYNEVPNEYPEAERVLKDRMRRDVFQRFADSAE